MRTRRRILLLLLAAAAAPACAGRQALPADEAVAEVPAKRPPLRRFRYSRAAQQDAQGFYYQPTGLADDYPEETTTPAKIARDFEAMSAAGVKVFRFAFGWDSIEPEPGEHDFLFWDQVVAAAKRHDITLIPYVCYTPRWLSTDPVDFWRRPPSDPARFGRFMEVIVRRYRDTIHAWELWNEPDNRDYWLGDVDELAALLREGARGVRRADPGAVIVLGGLTQWPDGAFLEALLERHAAASWLDVINLHGYAGTWDPRPASEYPARIAATAALLPRPGPDLWMAEFGYSSDRPAPGAPTTCGVAPAAAHERTPAYQAVQLFKHHVLALVPGRLSLTAWYRINDLPGGEEVIGDACNRHLGLLDALGHPKPALRALRHYNRLFDLPARTVDARVSVRAPEQSRAELHAFEEKDGGLLVVGWLRPRGASGSPDTPDTAREVVAVTLPDAGAGKYRLVAVYDALGRPGPAGAAVAGGELTGVELGADGLFIAELRR